MPCCDTIRSFPVAARAFVRTSVGLAALAAGHIESAVSAAAFGQESTAARPCRKQQHGNFPRGRSDSWNLSDEVEAQT
jgi:hypothetical protein